MGVNYGAIAKKFQALADESEASSSMHRGGMAEVSVTKRTEISTNKRASRSSKASREETEVNEDAPPPARSLAQKFEALARESAQTETKQEDEHEDLACHRPKTPMKKKSGIPVRVSKKKYGESAATERVSSSSKSAASGAHFQRGSHQSSQDAHYRDNAEADGGNDQLDFSKSKSKVSATLSKTLLQKFQKFTAESEAIKRESGQSSESERSGVGPVKRTGSGSLVRQSKSGRKSSGTIRKTGSLPSVASSRPQREEEPKVLQFISRGKGIFLAIGSMLLL